MRLTDGETRFFGVELRRVSDAHHDPILLKALRVAVHRVGDERASQPVQRAMIFGGALGDKHAVFLLEGNAVRHTHIELALRALHFDLTSLQRDFHALRKWNWFVADT